MRGKGLRLWTQKEELPVSAKTDSRYTFGRRHEPPDCKRRMATVHKSLFHKPLFRPEAIRPAMKNFIMPDRVGAMRPTLALWAKKLTGKKLDRLKETELLPDFITDIFGGLLGYSGPVSQFDIFSMKCEGLVKVRCRASKTRPDLQLSIPIPCGLAKRINRYEDLGTHIIKHRSNDLR